MRYSAETSASPARVLLLARERFGTAGEGLALTDASLERVAFGGPVGYVAVEARRGNGGAVVIVETREFDDAARRFLLDLPRQSRFAALARMIRAKIAPRTKP